MRFSLFLLLALAPGLAFANASVPAETAAATGNPYTGIAGRNVFALVPIPTNAPVVEAPPKEPPPKITANGIMDLFGQLQVLFKVAAKPAAGQPPKDKAYVLGQGERADDIEVVKINQAAGTITFRNHGELQDLALAEAPKISTPAPAVTAAGSIAAPNTVPMPNSRAAAAAARFGLRQGAGNPAAAAATEQNLGAASAQATPANIEEQVINAAKQMAQIELNRIETQEAVDKGILPPLPPTMLTPSDATGHGGSPLIQTPEPVAPKK